MTDNKEYLSYAYNVDGSKSTVKGNSISELLDKWRKLESLRDDNDKIKSFYAVEKDSTGKYGEATRYDIATGKDITPVYFELPSLNKEDFERTVEQLKNDGAHFNPSKKAWYVTKDMDLSKFDKYINPKADAASKRDTQIYLELPSLSKEDFKLTVEQLKNDGAHFDSKKKAWYVTKDMDLSKFDKYINPEPIYLEIPPLSKEDFKLTVEQLKNDGAHFDSKKKAWYVTKDMDLSKFDKYINPKADAASKRESQVEKLENYKNEIYVTEKKANAPKQTKAKNRKNEVKKQEAVR